MKLVLREYLSTLKESEELDALIPLILLSMGIKPIHTAQRGVTQYGVDVHAIGIDPDDRKKKNFLITIKPGDVDRASWDSGAQAVRPSLVEIKDVYIRNMSREQKKLPTKIVLACGGELRQENQARWEGFRESNSTRKVKYELWDGNQLAIFLEENLLDEFLFSTEAKIEMRRTLAALEDPDYDLKHFKKMISVIFDEKRLKGRARSISPKKVVNSIRVIKVCLSLIEAYSKEEGSLKHAIVACENAMLRIWHFILKNEFKKNPQVASEYYSLYGHYFKCSALYYNRIGRHCHVRDGITQSCRSSITASMVTMEQIGILGAMGVTQFHFAYAHGNEVGLKNAVDIAETLEALLKNNSISASPVFDGQIIDISLAMYFLALLKKNEVIDNWIREIVFRFFFSYVALGEHFPICYDSVDTLMEFEYGKEHTKEEMTAMSTLIPTLAYWCAALNLEERYQDIVKVVNENLDHTCLQVWFPNQDIKQSLFNEPASRHGVMEAPIILPEKLDVLKDRLKHLLKRSVELGIPTKWSDTPPGLALIASRHFRTPVIPFYWLVALEEKVQA